MAITTVRDGFFFSGWNPPTTFWVRARRTHVANLFLRNPCWVSASGRSATNSGRIRRSRTFIAGRRSEMGLFDVSRWRSLPAFGIGMITACFHIARMLIERREKLNKWMRCSMTFRPRCFRWWMMSPSGSGAVVFFSFWFTSQPFLGWKVWWCGWAGGLVLVGCTWSVGYGCGDLFAKTGSYFEIIWVGLVVKYYGLVNCGVLFLSG